MESNEIALLAAEAAADKKAGDVVVMDVSELLGVTDYFVIATGRSDQQVRAIAEEVERRLREDAHAKPAGREGMDRREWVLLDYGGIVVHVFQPDVREFYRLENLWQEAPRLPLPDAVAGPARKASEDAT